MAPASIFDRARRYLRCHPYASLLVTDAWEIAPDHHECEVMCCRCNRSAYFDISRKEYQQMANRKPWIFKQEGNRGRN